MDGKPFVKKDSNSNFDVSIGGYDSCQCCEIVGLFLLDQISKVVPPHRHGLYRDDGMLALLAHGGDQDDIRKALVKIFADNNFTITYKVNVKETEFLDVLLNLDNRSFRPFKKKNDETKYVHAKSSHAPSIIKGIGESVNTRINKLSSSEEIFNQAKGNYQQALKKSEHDFKMYYKPKEDKEKVKKKKTRSRRVVYFTPPYSLKIKTQVGKAFFKAIERWFPKGHPLSRYLNKNTLKLSYSTTRNLKKIVAAHNRKVLSAKIHEEMDPCNCRGGVKNCPLQGKCRIKNIVYQVDVEVPGQPVKTYFGQTIYFKTRYYQHNTDMNPASKSKGTALSRYVLNWKSRGITPKLKWSIKARATPYKSGSSRCSLCLKEKTAIAMCPPERLLNSRTEILHKCTHRREFELQSICRKCGKVHRDRRKNCPS